MEMETLPRTEYSVAHTGDMISKAQTLTSRCLEFQWETD